LPEQVLADILSPDAMTSPGIPGKKR
jgi:hypothetical protein